MGQLKDLVVTGATRLLGKITTKDVEINGGLIINPGSKANHNEGIRINKANGGWATLVLGAEPGSTSGTGSGIWSMHTYNGNFYLSHNGSDNGSPMIKGDSGSWNIYGTTIINNDISMRRVIDFQSNYWTGYICARNANGNLRYELYCNNNPDNVMDGRIGNVNLDVVKDNSGGRSRYIFGTDGTFTAAGFSGTLYGTATHTNVLNTYSDLTFGVNRLQYFNQITSVTSGANVNANPFDDWFHIIRMNHANTLGYYVDLATCFHSNAMYYRRIASGTDHGWVRIIDSDNYSSYALPLTGGTINGNITVTGDVTVGGVSLKTSVSNGKTAVSGAITDMGISNSSPSDTFETMAANIRSIIVGNATANCVLSGYTYYSQYELSQVSQYLRLCSVVSDNLLSTW